MAGINYQTLKKVLTNSEKILTKILIFLIKIYQIFVARLLGGCNCRFEPTCSHYMLEAVEKKGLTKGFLLGVGRILRCHPFSKKSGYDPVL